MWKRIARVLRGDFSRSVYLCGLLPLLLVSFFGSLIFAARHFPQRYDWRYRVISNLLSPRDNRAFYKIAAAGLAFSAILLFPATSYLTRRLRRLSPSIVRIAAGCFAAGSALLFLAATVVPQHVHPVLGMTRLHESLARTAALAFGIGMLCCCHCAASDFFGKKLLSPALTPTWLALTVTPLATIASSQILLWMARSRTSFALPIQRALRHSPLWHLGFWEWLGAAAFCLFLLAGGCFLPSD